LMLVVPPIVISAVMTYLWDKFFRHLHVPKGAKDILGFAIVVQAAIFAIAAAMVLGGAWERVRMLSRHVLVQDQTAFMEIRDERMPISMHFVLAASGLSVLMLLSIAPYPDEWSGIIIVSSTWFVMSLYFMVVAALQNILHSPWIRNRMPQHWHGLKVDEYFSTGYSERKTTITGRAENRKSEAAPREDG
jgi:uncharacterized membrane protein